MMMVIRIQKRFHLVKYGKVGNHRNQKSAKRYPINTTFLITVTDVIIALTITTHHFILIDS